MAARAAGAALAGAVGRRIARRCCAIWRRRWREPDARQAIFAANAADLERARAAAAAGAPVPASIKRLGLDAAKLDSVIEGLRQLAAMPELTNQVTLRRELDDGLVLERKTCPLGVLGVVFEARPDALVQIVGLAWKSGNAVLLKGGSEARESNRALIGGDPPRARAARPRPARDGAARGSRRRRRAAGPARRRRSDRRARLVGVRAARAAEHAHPGHGARRRRLPPVPARRRRSGDGGARGRRRQVQLPGGLQQHRGAAVGPGRGRGARRGGGGADRGRRRAARLPADARAPPER